MMNQDPAGTSIKTRLRTLRTLWAAFLINIGIFALVAYMALGEREREDATIGGDFPILYLFFAVGLSLIAVSFVVKRIFVQKAEREQRVELVQTGLIVAFALCESAALIGLVALFIYADLNAYALFVLAALGQLLHFPRRDPLLAATHGRAI